MSQDNVNAQEPEAPSLEERIADLHRRSDEALVALNACVARISGLGGGIRLSTLLKTQAAFVIEQQTLRAAEASVGLALTLDAALGKIDAFIAEMRPRRTSRASAPQAVDSTPVVTEAVSDAVAVSETTLAEGPTATEGSISAEGSTAAEKSTVAQDSTATEPIVAPASGPNASALRQALIRMMVALAPAPLRLQIEFSSGFDLMRADPVALAVRSHVVHRAVLGSLRRIQWEALDACTLWFGDGNQRRTVQAGFTPAGKIRIADEYRQNLPGGAGAGAGAVAGANARGARANVSSAPQRERRPAAQGGPSVPSGLSAWPWPTRASVTGEGASRDRPPRDGAEARGQGARPGGRGPGGARPEGQRPSAPRQDGRRGHGPRPDGQRSGGPRPEGQRTEGQRPAGPRLGAGPRHDGRPSQSGPRADGRGPQGAQGVAGGARGSQQPNAGAPRQGGGPGGQRPGADRSRGDARGPGGRPDRGAGPRGDRPDGGFDRSGPRGRNPREGRDSRDHRDSGNRGASFPRNSLMSDKLRAALSSSREPGDGKDDSDK